MGLATVQRYCAVCDGVWVVCMSVCLSAKIVSPAKLAEPIEMPFEMWTRVGQRNHVLHGGPDSPMRRGNFEGEFRTELASYIRPIVTYKNTAQWAASRQNSLTTCYYLRQGGYVFVVVCLFVCLFVNNFAQKLLNGFAWNFQGRLAVGPVNKWLNFGGHPGQGSGYGSWFGSVSWHW